MEWNNFSDRSEALKEHVSEPWNKLNVCLYEYLCSSDHPIVICDGKQLTLADVAKVLALVLSSFKSAFSLLHYLTYINIASYILVIVLNVQSISFVSKLYETYCRRIF